MKYKILLAGTNRSIIDDFFYVLHEDFQCVTTSNRSGDIVNHMRFFNPNAFVYCFANETKDDIAKLVAALEGVSKKYRHLILIGDQEPCQEFLRLKPQWVDMYLQRPISTATIRERILKYFEQNLVEVDIKDELGIQEIDLADLDTLDLAELDTLDLEELDTLDLEELDTLDFAELEKGALESDISNNPADEVSDWFELVKAISVGLDSALSKVTKKQILVVDDDTKMLKMISAGLKEEYDVATAISGEAAMKFLEYKAADLILLDYEMPGEDGASVLRKIRSNPRTKDVPVIFLTGINDREKIKKVMPLKPQGYLLKPIERDKLIKFIKDTIG